MEPGTGASVGQRVTGDVVRLSRNSSSTLSPLILFLHMLHNRGSTCSSCVGVQRVLILGKTLGVLIAQGQLWGCNPCARGRQCARYVGIVEIPLWCVGLESGAPWCYSWC